MPFFSFFILFLIAGIALTYPSLCYPWYGDDVHLIRSFSAKELAQTFTGDWDVDHIETPGYRPLTVLFNTFRAGLFGESVAAHRVFQIALVAAYFSVVAGIAMHLGMSYGAAAFAGVFTICTKNNWWNLVWIADGVHAFAGFLLVSAAYLSLSAVKKFAWWKIAS